MRPHILPAGAFAVATLALLAASAATAASPSSPDSAAAQQRSAPTSPPAAATAGLIASGPAGADSIALLECTSGAVRARVRAPGTLAAPVVADFSAGSLYAATREGELLRYSLPGLALQARRPLGFGPTALGASRGPDAVVLAGGTGEAPLSAHDPHTLAPLARYPMQPAARVAEILDVGARGRFVVGFADRTELWEIAYDRNAPPVLRGLVHDYRMGEAVTLPGRLTPRPFEVPGATRALVAGTSAFEVLRVDADDAIGVVNLDVRREIERPRLRAPPNPRTIAPWSRATRRGWLIAAEGGAASVLEAPDWRVAAIALGGPARVLATGADPGISLVVIDGPSGAELLHVDAAGARVLGRSALGSAGTTAERIVLAADGGCAALLDGRGRWVASAGATR